MSSAHHPSDQYGPAAAAGHFCAAILIFHADHGISAVRTGHSFRMPSAVFKCHLPNAPFLHLISHRRHCLPLKIPDHEGRNHCRSTVTNVSGRAAAAGALHPALRLLEIQAAVHAAADRTFHIVCLHVHLRIHFPLIRAP